MFDKIKGLFSESLSERFNKVYENDEIIKEMSDLKERAKKQREIYREEIAFADEEIDKIESHKNKMKSRKSILKKVEETINKAL